MADNMDVLSSKSFKDLTLPGTHDSGSYELTRQLMPEGSEVDLEDLIKFAESIHIPVQDLITPWALSQDLDFYEQLSAGARYIDLRAGWNGTEWCTFHMEVGLPIRLLLPGIVRFLHDYPSEVVLVEVSHLTGSPTAAQEQQLLKLLNSSFGELLLPLAPRFPPLSAMVASNQRALVTVGTDWVVEYPLLWPGNTVLNSYADSPVLATMVSYNQQQLARFTANRAGAPVNGVFKMSWTLTPTAHTIIDGVLPGARPHSLIELADTAIAALGTFLTSDCGGRVSGAAGGSQGGVAEEGVRGGIRGRAMMTQAQQALRPPGNILILDHFEAAQAADFMPTIIAFNTQQA